MHFDIMRGRVEGEWRHVCVTECPQLHGCVTLVHCSDVLGKCALIISRYFNNVSVVIDLRCVAVCELISLVGWLNVCSERGVGWL